MNDNRRQFVRFDMPMGVEFHVQGETSNYFGVIKDFSREGLSLVAHNISFGQNSALELKLQLPDSHESVNALGDVVWAQEINGQWNVGVKLREIDRGIKMDILSRAYDSWIHRLHS